MFIYQAHRQERKAEKLISGKKYMEALACYEIASGLNIYIFTYNTIMFTLIFCKHHFQKYLYT
jgi:hypothetical protein